MITAKIKSVIITGLGVISALSTVYGIITRLHLNAEKAKVETLETKIVLVEEINKTNQRTIQIMLGNERINKEYRIQLETSITTLEEDHARSAFEAFQAVTQMDNDCLSRPHPREFNGLFKL